MSSSLADAPVLRLQVAAGAGGCERRLDERAPQPGAAFAGRTALAFAGRLVVAGRELRPGSEMAAGGEDAHVDADLSDDHLGVAPADAGDRLQQRGRRRERGDLLLDPGRAS